ncbi:hypothetical protein BC629DRAFT_29103 [Irpex lacteus]|nr:hypothetical protein BC629DRAFT_29103 [Irpex lacteus]
MSLRSATGPKHTPETRVPYRRLHAVQGRMGRPMVTAVAVSVRHSRPTYSLIRSLFPVPCRYTPIRSPLLLMGTSSAIDKMRRTNEGYLLINIPRSATCVNVVTVSCSRPRAVSTSRTQSIQCHVSTNTADAIQQRSELRGRWPYINATTSRKDAAGV